MICVSYFVSFPQGVTQLINHPGYVGEKLHAVDTLKQELTNFLVKNQIANILGIVGHTVSVTSTYSALQNEALKQVRMAQIYTVVFMDTEI